MSVERGHHLIVTKGPDWTEDDPEYRWTVTCLNPNACNGWQECPEDHNGYDPKDKDSLAYDEWEDVEIHGVLHEWHWGHGWTVPYEGCCVADNLNCWGGVDSADDIAQEHGVGTHVVDDDWDDTDLTLTWVKTIAEGDK